MAKYVRLMTVRGLGGENTVSRLQKKTGFSSGSCGHLAREALT